MMFDTVKTLRELIKVRALPGGETEMAHCLADLARPYATDIRTDALGNLIVHKRGEQGGKSIVVAAHMDTAGVVVTHIDDAGFLRFAPLAAPDRLNTTRLLGARIQFTGDLYGVIEADGDYNPGAPQVDHLYIDIGASNREQAAGLHVGDAAAFVGEIHLSGGRVLAPSLDGRLGCVLLLQLLAAAAQPVGDLYCVFTAQGAVGQRGAGAAAYALSPDYAIAVDLSPCGDTPDSKHTAVLALGGGAAIRLVDGPHVCHPQVVSLLRQLAESGGIPHQMDARQSGAGSEAAPMQLAREGAYTGVVGVPARYVHTQSALCDLADIEAALRLLAAFVNHKSMAS